MASSAKSSDAIELRRLIEEVRQGSEDAIREFVETFGPDLLIAVRGRMKFSLRRHFESADFMQDIWASVFARPEFFNREITRDELIRYLSMIARRKVSRGARNINRAVRSPKRAGAKLERLEMGKGYDERTPAPRDRRQPTPSQIAVANETWERLIKDASPNQQKVLALRLEGHGVVEVSKQLGVSKRTVERLLNRARGKS